RPGCCRTTAPGPTTGCGRTCGGSRIPMRSTWSSWAAGRAARYCCTGSHGLYWTDPRVISGTDPVPMGSNNSGRGVGGSMVHYAGYTPRFHPSDFCTRSEDGVGADWPVTYAELRPYYEAVER